MRDNFVAGRYLISGDDVLDADEENDRANKRQTEGQDGVALSSVKRRRLSVVEVLDSEDASAVADPSRELEDFDINDGCAQGTFPDLVECFDRPASRGLIRG